MIVFDRVSVTYDDAPAPTLDTVSFVLPEGELCLVAGPTGSGKSTLLKCINGLVPHFTGGTMAGQAVVDGRSTRTHHPRDLVDVVGYVGNTGNARSTPPHLHFGIYRRGEGPIDPLPFVNGARGPAASSPN